MIYKGMALRFRENYTEEIDYARSLGFDYFQIWFYNGVLSVETLPEPKEQAIKKALFPVILHAVFDMPDYEQYGQKLLELIEFFGHKEVIIHPICKSEQITTDTIYSLKTKINLIHQKLSKRNVKLYVENNSVIDGFFNTIDDLRIIFESCPDIGLLLDLAHINNYDHLKEIVEMRFPECIHIADKHFGIAHEHITLGDGDLDFEMIFNQIIPRYSGRIILEAVDSKGSIQKSKKILDTLFKD
jgi:sugar phosphate isomerase/epimerase